MVERIIWAVLADILSVRSRYSSHSAFQRLILRRWNKIKTSFWGFEDKPLFSSPHFEDLIRKSKRQNVALVAEYPPSAQNEHSVERQIYRVDKMSTRRWNRKYWGSVDKEKGSQGILPFPLCPKSAKATFNGPNWTVDFKCHIWTLDFSAGNSQRVPWKQSQNMVK